MRIFQVIALLVGVVMTSSAAGPASGDWTGVIKVSNMDLRLALHVTESAKGLQATFDSIDQKVMGMPVDKIEVRGQEIKFEIVAIQAAYTGTLNKTGTAITGSWSQLGMAFPLNFQKQLARK